MKLYSTNYYNTFIEVAEDCPANKGEMPPVKANKKSVANLQFEMLYENPYKYNSDDVLFGVLAIRKAFTKAKMDKQRALYFSKGQPCFRASPLTKRYGWGIHSNDEGKIAMFGVETEAYKSFMGDDSVKKVKAMKSRR